MTIVECFGELGTFTNSLELDMEAPYHAPGDKEGWCLEAILHCVWELDKLCLNLLLHQNLLLRQKGSKWTQNDQLASSVLIPNKFMYKNLFLKQTKRDCDCV
jgi:hypothetical protein